MKKLQEKILVIGRAGLDLYADPVNTPIEHATKFISQLGGSAANIAAGLAKQGNDVDLFSTISDDSIGDFVINSCKDLGINTELLFKVSNSKNTLAIVDTMGNATKAVLYRDNPADLFLNESYLKNVDLDSYRLIIITGTSLSRNPSRETVLYLMEMGMKKKIEIILDIDYRHGSWEDNQEAEKVLYSAAMLSNIVVGNDLEFNFMSSGKDQGFALASEMSKKHNIITIYKMGSEGLYYFNNKKKKLLKSFKVNSIKPTGAGDAFLSSFCSSRIKGNILSESIKYGAAAGAIVVTRVGCSNAMPDLTEIEEFIQNYN